MAAGSDPHVTPDHRFQDRRQAGSSQGTLDLLTVDVTSAWVHWYNTARLMHRLGRRPPAEAEAEYYQQAKDAA